MRFGTAVGRDGSASSHIALRWAPSVAHLLTNIFFVQQALYGSFWEFMAVPQRWAEGQVLPKCVGLRCLAGLHWFISRDQEGYAD
jgi:hypothetical protein